MTEVSAEATAVMGVMGVAADWAGAVETEAEASTTNRCASSGERGGGALHSPSLPGRRPSSACYRRRLLDFTRIDDSIARKGLPRSDRAPCVRPRSSVVHVLH